MAEQGPKARAAAYAAMSEHERGVAREEAAVARDVVAGLRSGLPPMHPGELLGEVVIPAVGKSKVEIAQLLGVSRQTLYDVLDGKKAVTPQMALRLGKLCGNGPDLWLNLQNAWDLARARSEIAGELERIPTLEEAAV